MANDQQELPDDVLTEILFRLPVKSLLRFRSISKYWYSLIQNSSFIALHRNRAASITENIADCLLVKRYLNSDYDVNLVLSSSDPNKTPISHDKLALSLVPGETPIDEVDMSFTGLNINDFVLLHYSNGLIFGCTNRSTLLICNLAMRECRVLPEPPHESWRNSCLGFGFDPNSDDYKVIRVARIRETDIRSFDEIDCPLEKSYAMSEADYRIVGEKVQVYNLCTDSWREVHTLLPQDLIYAVSSSLNGVFYWLAGDTGDTSNTWWIVAFFMREEVFDIMPVPERVSKSCYEFTTLFNNFCAVNDSFAMVTATKFRGKIGWCLDVWVIGEFGVMDSWSKKYSIGPPLGRHLFELGFRQNGELLLVRSGLLYNTEKQVITKYCGESGEIIEEYEVYDVSDDPFSGLYVDALQVLPYKECLVSVKRH